MKFLKVKIQIVLFLLALLSGFGGSHGGWADGPQDLDSKIKTVTVYSDRALVTRESQIKLLEGTNTLVFTKLPLNIDDRSVRAALVEKHVKIVGIETKQRMAEKTAPGKLADLEAQIQGVQDDIKANGDTLELLKSKMDFLEALKAAKADKISKEMINQPGSSLKDWTDMLTFVEQEIKAIHGERRKTQVGTRELQKKLASLDFERQKIAHGVTQQYKEVKVTVDAGANGNATVHLQYVIPGATWSPLYDARVLTDDGKVELVYYGMVSQRTGEDWSDVDLVLSTAKPSVGGQLAAIQPWLLTVAMPMVRGGYAPGAPLSQMDKLNFYRGKEDAAKKMSEGKQQFSGQGYTEAALESSEKEELKSFDGSSYDVAGTDAGMTSVSFVLKKKETIPSDGQPHKTAVAMEKYPAQFEYDASPILSPYAYLKAKLTNGDLPLIGGSANVFFDQDFAGNSWIKTTQAGEPFDAYFGVDEGVKVERKLEKKEEGSTQGFLNSGATYRTKYLYKMTVQNFKKTLVKFNLKDRLPTSQHQDVKVEEVRVDPEPTEKTPKGLLRWTFDLKPMEKRTFTVEYAIEHPKDKALITTAGQ